MGEAGRPKAVASLEREGMEEDGGGGVEVEAEAGRQGSEQVYT